MDKNKLPLPKLPQSIKSIRSEIRSSNRIDTDIDITIINAIKFIKSDIDKSAECG